MKKASKELKQEVLASYIKLLDLKYPEGWEFVTNKMGNNLYVSNLFDKKDLIKHTLTELEVYKETLFKSGKHPLFNVEISTTNPGNTVDRKQIEKNKNFKVVYIDYRPLDAAIFKKTSKGSYFFIDYTVVIPNYNNPNRFQLRQAFIEKTYRDFAPQGSLSGIDKIMDVL